MNETRSLPNVIQVIVNAGTPDEKIVEVRKLPLGRAAQLGIVIRRLIKKITELQEREGIKELLASGQMDDLPLTEVVLRIMDYIPEVLEVAADVFIDLLHVGTGLSRKELEEKIGLDDAAALFAAVVTVNNLEAIQNHVKNALTRLGLTKQAAPVQETGTETGTE